MTDDADASASACPVDHKARAAWLEKSKQAPHPIPPEQNPLPANDGCDSSRIDQSTTTSPPAQLLSRHLFTRAHLGKDREISSIPRAGIRDATATPRPANNEQETGADEKSGKWIYPSEEMFFNAMRRKNYDPKEEDMRSIVPIHNAVNEQAWKEIKRWENGKGADACGGPRLVSFSGLATSMTPKARLNTLMGYRPPFDRHDWVVDRCGKRVEYVIDFYSGREENNPGKSLNFYLDVRPKLNTWEGWRMRAERLLGM